MLPPSEYAPFYHTYVSKVPEGLPLDAALDQSFVQLEAFLARVPESQAGYAYGPGKWTVAQSLQHVIDTERIFAYRALVFARGDAGPLPGFDQDEFVAYHGIELPSLADLREQLRLVRASTRLMFRGFRESDLLLQGTMSGNVHSVRAIGMICAGHVYHHAQLYNERYGAALT